MILKNNKKVLVTGAAGFMGCNLCESLLKLGLEVHALDNLSTGRIDNIRHLMAEENFHFVKIDLLDVCKNKTIQDDFDLVFHFAANPEIRAALTDPDIDFKQNLIATHRLLELMRNSSQMKTIAFASTSTVYGEAEIIPTSEDYGLLKPISLYGATKLGCEALIASYTHTFGLKGLVFRFANIVGPRLRHGVIHDFISKLATKPRELEILGNGTQSKSYLHIEDCLDGIFTALESFNDMFEVYNVGGKDQVNVKTIAEIIVEEMGFKNIKFKFSGGPEGRGWLGDVKTMLLDCSKLRNLGWKNKYFGVEAIQLATRQLINESRITID